MGVQTGGRIKERIIKLPMWVVTFKRKNANMILTKKCKDKREANKEKKLIDSADNLEFIEMVQYKLKKSKKKKDE